MMTDLKFIYKKYKESGKVSTDTRSITPGAVFFALRGEKFNGNELANEALDKGACCAVVDEEAWAKDGRYLLVQDSLQTLQQLARHHRDQLNIPVVALTGSNGKTTTKELIHAVLGQRYRVLATAGNLNNHIGVPLTLLAIDHTIEIAVIEMGANHAGEIAHLCKLANPTHGLITNIGKAHIGTFGGMDNIIKGKSELYAHLAKHQGTVWINSQNQLLTNMAGWFKDPLFYPARNDFYHCELLAADPYVKVRTEEGEIISTNLIGAYNFENVAAALCVAKFFKVDSHKAAEAMRNYVPANMRSQVIKRGSNTIILDAYNANPSSMEAAIASLSHMPAEHKVAILGDMFELGEETEQAHRRLAAWLEAAKIGEVYLCGQLIRPAFLHQPGVKYFETRELLINYLKEHPIRNSTILVKASRGMALEHIIDHLP